MVLLLIFIIVLPTCVFAHKPIFSKDDNTTKDEAQEIPDVSISHALYGRLEENTRNFYKFSIKEPVEFYGEMTVPGNDPNYSPSFRILNIGTFHPNEREKGFFEPFTQTSYIRKQETKFVLDPGDYIIEIFHREGRAGRYAMAVGEEEEWGFSDLLTFPIIWLRTNWWYSPTRTVLIVIILLIIVFFIIKKLMKKININTR